MINIHWVAVAKFSLALAFAGALIGQTTGDFERRLQELERKMRELDPSFRQVGTDEDLRQRLVALERKMDEVLAARSEKSTEPPAQAQEPPAAHLASLPLQPVGPLTGYRTAPDEESRLPVSGYMDFHFNKPRGEPGQLDFHRFVLQFGHNFSERIKFWSELEVEHALVEGRAEKGELELEQAYLDFLIKPWFNLRAGMVLTPVGIMNERHEPPSFNGVERPMVETVIIPSTWFDAGVGFTGDLGRGFRYRAYVMSGLDATGFDAEEGIRNGRQRGFQSSFRNPAKVGRLEYQGIRKLTLGASAYTGHSGFNLRGINPRVDVFDVDGRYNWRRFDMRGLFAHVNISRSRELNIAQERDLGFNPNIARQMRGWYLEPAVHAFPR